MVRQWKLFKGGPIAPRSDRMHVTLNPRGVILINQKLFEAMGSPEAALLLYDERMQAIGVQPAGRGDGYSFLVRHKENTSHRTIYAWPFCKSNKIYPQRTLFFTQPELDHNGVLVLDMHKTEELVSRRERSSRQ